MKKPLNKYALAQEVREALAGYACARWGRTRYCGEREIVMHEDGWRLIVPKGKPAEGFLPYVILRWEETTSKPFRLLGKVQQEKLSAENARALRDCADRLARWDIGTEMISSEGEFPQLHCYDDVEARQGREERQARHDADLRAWMKRGEAAQQAEALAQKERDDREFELHYVRPRPPMEYEEGGL